MTDKGLCTKTGHLNWVSNIWPGGPNSYSSKISSKCTRTERNAIWRYFVSIWMTWLCGLLHQSLQKIFEIVMCCVKPFLGVFFQFSKGRKKTKENLSVWEAELSGHSPSPSLFIVKIAPQHCYIALVLYSVAYRTCFRKLKQLVV